MSTQAQTYEYYSSTRNPTSRRVLTVAVVAALCALTIWMMTQGNPWALVPLMAMTGILFYDVGQWSERYRYLEALRKLENNN